ncbi:hypothetical protein RCC89_07650 [Cytophagaceae bacterium ABcell3]|nr:hypothetical protein RCC89_07650 [Cytophagaceae bacterium ABcell3]
MLRYSLLIFFSFLFFASSAQTLEVEGIDIRPFISDFQSQPEIMREKFKNDTMPDPARHYMQWALLEYNTGHYKKAIPLLKKVYQSNPDIFFEQAIALAYFYSEDYETAVSYILDSIDTGNEMLPPDSYGIIALSYLNMEEYEKAEDYFSEGIENHPDNLDLRFARGEYYNVIDNYEACFEEMNYYWDNGGERLYSMMQMRARCALGMEDEITVAIRDLENCLKYKDSNEDRYFLAVAYAMNNDTEGFYKHFHKLLYAKNAEVFMELFLNVIPNHFNDKPDFLLKIINEIESFGKLNFSGGTVMACQLRAKLYAEKGDTLKAVKVIDRELDNVRGEQEMLLYGSRLSLLMGSENYESTFLKDFDTLLELTDDDCDKANLYVFKANHYHQRKNKTLSLEAINEAIDLCPADPNLYFARLMFRADENSAESASDLKHIMGLMKNKDSWEYHLLKAALLDIEGEDGMAYFKEQVKSEDVNLPEHVKEFILSEGASEVDKDADYMLDLLFGKESALQ